MTAPQLDQNTLKRLLAYEPTTGTFAWHHRDDVPKSWNTKYAGKPAGCAWPVRGSKLTYWIIRIFDWPFLGHRLAFLYMTGDWPLVQVDHIDLNGLNNRWINLRDATRSQNLANTRAWRNNSTGFKGVSLCKKTGRYRATISLNSKQKWLGSFDTPEAAHAAYCHAARERSGKFARMS